MLRARLLGAFEVTLDGRGLAGLNAPRLQAVLAYLLLHRGASLARQHIAFTFWPDTPEDKARNNLRQIIHQLRHALPDADRHLHVETNTLGWLNTTDFSLDVAEFEDVFVQAIAARKASHTRDEMAVLEKAAGAYGGDLLPGCYDDWVLPERERLRQTFAEVLDRLAALHEAERNLPAAIAAAQRRLELDPLHEASYVTLMRLHALNDDRAGALRVYQAGVVAFKNELGIAPGAAMQAAHVRLQHGVPAQTQDASPELTPLIGRRREWEQLLAAWHGSAKGQPQCVSIAGEAGIGKTRLAEELMAWARRQGIGVAHARAYAAEGRLSFAPAVEWLRSEALHGALKRLDGVWLSEIGRILPEVFVAQPKLPQPAAMTDATQRTRFFEALARAVLLAPQPLLLVMDDAQWCDQDTLEWLRFLLRFDAKAKLLVVATCRSEEVDDKHPLMALLRDLRNAGAMHEIELHRLDAAETAKLAMHILKREVDLSEATRLYGDTEGNPLFTVELARAGLQRGVEVKPGEGTNLPPRIHAVIAARFAQLSAPAVEVMQMGATVGRAFTFDVLLKASEASEESLLRSLDELWQRRIVRSVDGSGYDFTHDKLREVAYGQIGPVKRRLLHRRAAQAIEAVHAADLDPVSAQLAAQFEMAGALEQAIVFYQRSALAAKRVFAIEEALMFIQRGLSLVQKLPNSRDRLEFECDLLVLLQVAFGDSIEFRVLDQYTMVERAYALSRQLGRRIPPVLLRSLATNYVIRAKYKEACQVSMEMLELAEETQDPVYWVGANEALGVTYGWMGDFPKARNHLEKALAYYSPEQSITYITNFSWEPSVVSQCRLALTLWFLGYPDQAIQLQQVSQKHAEILGHPFTLAYAMTWNVFLQIMLGDLDAAARQAEAIIAYSTKNPMAWWLRQSRLLNAWARASLDNELSSVAKTQHMLDEYVALGIGSFQLVFHYTNLARLCLRLGMFDRSHVYLVDAQNYAEKNNERWYEAEMHRTRGDVLLAHGASAIEIEPAYQQAIDVARHQQAKLLELRATVSLARLWQTQGRRADALNLLQPIYDWFTEGFDTRDLKQTKALLDELTLS